MQKTLTIFRPLNRWANETARCQVLGISAQYVELRVLEDGSIVCAQRSDGRLTGPRGGRGGGTRSCPARWVGWRVLRYHAIQGFWADPDDEVQETRAEVCCPRCAARFVRSKEEPHKLCPACRATPWTVWKSRDKRSRPAA